MYPLGNFDQNAAVDKTILEAAKKFAASLPDVPAGLLTRGYYHWTVAPMGMCFADYNFEALYDGSWQLKMTHDPRDNAPGLDNNAVASHTYMRNTGAIGIAITGMDGAGVGVHNFGTDPVTVSGLTWLCAGMAAVCFKYGIDVNGTSGGSPYGGEPNLLTHAEAANRPGNPQQYDNYFVTGERWDLATFVPLPDGVNLTAEDASTCGNALRKLTHAYKAAMGD
jgi:hypothetical protein